MRSKNVVTMFVVALSLFVSHSEARAQESADDAHHVWVDLSGGFSGIRYIATTVSGDLRWQDEDQVFTLQFVTSKEFEFPFPFAEYSHYTPLERVTSLCLLYGRTFSFHMFSKISPLFPFFLSTHQDPGYVVTASIGIAVFDKLVQGPIERPTDAAIAGIEGRHGIIDPGPDQSYVVGIPVELELVQRFSNNVGFVHRLFYHWDHGQGILGYQWGFQTYF